MFIALTMPGSGGFSDLPVFINVHQIRNVHPARLRKQGNQLGGPDAYEIRGTYVTVGENDEQSLRVTEDYGYVTGAIRDALKP